MNKLSTIEPSSHEYNITRNYVDWLTILPWGLFQAESYDLEKAPVVLDQEHYGLTEVKSRILEFIAVGKLRSSIQGKIILLVGPPGVGKTSIGKSIAKALDRQFYRFSVGGMTDTAEIKGHRRTYVGAMPGKLLQALKRVQVQNPVIMIDEIDKLGKSYQGDPASALLEVLDPEQNNAFVDHYLDVPFDLSKVLFVCTANSTSTIPRPLLDRMEVIQVSGYVADEKLEIARCHLIPESRSSTGVPPGALQLTVSAMRHLVRWYCREAGVRNLKKYIDRIYRKVAVGVAKDPQFSVVISHSNLHEYAGKPLYVTDRIYTSTPVGVVMGLAYTDMGGVALFVEAVAAPASSEGKGTSSFRITGQLGDVMKESTSVALTVASRFLKTLQPENNFFQETGVVMHIPEGAVPKDGPSAGVTMVTSLLSLATNRPVRPNVAMTGEITLTAKVRDARIQQKWRTPHVECF
jgi:Lon-like ATP-dependent protease